MKFFKNKMQTGATLGALALVGCLAAGPMYAYLTDNEQTTNTFTVGKVQIDLEEPHYPGNGAGEVTNIVPNQEIAKDPQVENTGKNSAVVFASVSIPVKNLVVAGANGTRQAEAMTQVFQTSIDNGTNYTSDGTVKNGWVAISTKYFDAAGTEVTATGDSIPTDAVKVVRTYGYNTALAAGKTTPTLFDKVKLVNVIEGYIDSTVQDIEVKTFAIQADHIVDNKCKDIKTAEAMKYADLTNIYDVYVTQNGENTGNKDADRYGKKNLLGNDNKASYTTRIYATIDNTVIEADKGAQMTVTVDAIDKEAGALEENGKLKGVTFSVSGNGKVSVNDLGYVTVQDDAENGTATITATYTYNDGDSDKTVTANVPITIKAAAHTQK